MHHYYLISYYTTKIIKKLDVSTSLRCLHQEYSVGTQFFWIWILDTTDNRPEID